MEKLIRLIKGSNNYSFETKLTGYETFLIICQRTIQIVRGLWLRLFIKAKGLLFVGAHVTVRHKNLISFGKNVILDDNVLLNGLSMKGLRLGNNVTIARDCVLICTGVIRNKGVGIEIGDNCALNVRSYIGGQGGVKIGSYVIIGPDVKIFSENHIFSDVDVPIKDQGESRIGVVINDNCWIGAGAIILDGVTLGKGTVVAAGTVVTHSFPDNVVLAGVPAKVIKERTRH